jgi:predicted dehydrogenase
MQRLKIAVLGAGHLGKIHIKCLKNLSDICELVVFYDNDKKNAQHVVNQFDIKYFESIDELFLAADAVDIVVPTSLHFEIGSRCISAGKHIFIEKPICQTVSEGLALCKLADAQKIKAQVGHVERFNPALLALKGYELQPKFIEAHRLAMFNPRGTDVSVVEDLMIHDLDILLHLVNSPVANVAANGVAIVSKAADIANARIEFENGAVANITASRISMKQMRKFRLFQPDAYISLDFLTKTTEIIKLHDSPQGENFSELDTAAGKKYLEIAMPESPANNAIELELRLFIEAILYQKKVSVSLQDGLAALELAHQILEKIEIANQVFIS